MYTLGTYMCTLYSGQKDAKTCPCSRFGHQLMRGLSFYFVIIFHASRPRRVDGIRLSHSRRRRVQNGDRSVGDDRPCACTR